MPGPLDGVRIIEFAGLGPGPFAMMLLSDLGADVIRIDRAEDADSSARRRHVLGRNRRSIAIDLKADQGVELALQLVSTADGLIEGFRPGVMERLGLGPEACMQRNARLVYGRITGWGQEGPYAGLAGHDLNYIALTGALAAIGRKGAPPSIPLALVGDFGGGGFLLAMGMVSALFEAARSGAGQVVDASMVDGAALMMSSFSSSYSEGEWNLERDTNLVDSGRPFYDVYECSDGEYMAVGALEPVFYARLLKALEINDIDPAAQYDPEGWDDLRERLRTVFASRKRDEWAALFEKVDACVAPVLSMAEAPGHHHNRARNTYTEVDGLIQGSVAPRFSRTPGAVTRGPARAGEHSDELLRQLGISEAEAERLKRTGVVR